MIRRKTTVALVAAMAVSPVAVFAAPANDTVIHAASNNVTRSMVVRTDDLNLASPRGRDAMVRRVRTAAQAVCGRVDMYGTRPPADYRRCLDRSVSSALAGTGLDAGGSVGGAN